MVIETTLMELLNLGFLTSALATQPTVAESSNILSVWLHTTDRCNLRCDYCYLPHARADMSSATGRAAIEAIFSSAAAHHYHAVKIKYAGGEPLLRLPFVIEMQHYAQALAQQHGIALDGIILSNGTLLTPEIVEAMRASELRLMISLDGLGDAHNVHRHFPDGRGSFEDVSCAVDLARANGVTPDISITISGRNANRLPEVVAWVLERDLPFSLNFYRENANSAIHTDMRLEEDRIIKGMLAAYKVIEAALPRRSMLASLADRANLSAPHLHTCSAGRDYLVFDAQGRVAKCQMALAQPVTDCHDPDPLNVLRNSNLGLQNLKVDDKAECQDCEWRYWCGGGCPLETYRVTGRYDVKSPNCAIYKALYPEVVRLEGLRLLKYADDKSAIQS
ncbi:MAG: radical SAM protein [Anaerolineae bacterium]|nr:radical SAM protein [Anaerolineae bacterium]